MVEKVMGKDQTKGRQFIINNDTLRERFRFF